MEINISADILPDNSLGNITLRDNLKNLINILKQNRIDFNASYANTYNKRVLLYSIFDGIIVIAIDNINNKIFRITANNGYKGKLLNRFQIGDTYNNVCNSEYGFYYDEQEDTILSNSIPGVSLDLEVTDYLDTDIKDPKIENISVFAVESVTLDGQRGNW